LVIPEFSPVVLALEEVFLECFGNAAFLADAAKYLESILA